jgi:hypothetical protein
MVFLCIFAFNKLCMDYSTNILEIISRLKNFLTATTTRETYRQCMEDFTRNIGLGFFQLCTVRRVFVSEIVGCGTT